MVIRRIGVWSAAKACARRLHDGDLEVRNSWLDMVG
jgi:hypothetical protein